MIEPQPSRFRRTRRRASNPAAPVPTSNSVAGSGVGTALALASSSYLGSLRNDVLLPATITIVAPMA